MVVNGKFFCKLTCLLLKGHCSLIPDTMESDISQSYNEYISGVDPSPYFQPTPKDDEFTFSEDYSINLGEEIDHSSILVIGDVTKDFIALPKSNDNEETDVTSVDGTVAGTDENAPIIIQDSSEEDGAHGCDSDDDVVFVGAGKVEFSSDKSKVHSEAVKLEPSSPKQSTELSPTKSLDSADNQALVVSSDIYDEMISAMEEPKYTFLGTYTEADFELSSGYNSASSSVEDLNNNNDVGFEEMDSFDSFNFTQMDHSVESEDLNGEPKDTTTWTFHRFGSDESVVPKNTCSVCFVQLSPRQLRRHVKSHEDESAVQCSSCFLIIESSMLLDGHMKSHYNEIEPDPSEFNHEVLENVKPICVYCDSYFDCEAELSMHQYDVFCDYCKQRVLCDSLVKRHVISKCEAYKKLYPCKFCKKGFKRSNSLWHHINHTTCKFCKELDQLKMKSDKIESDPLSVMCANCKLFLPAKENLRQHKELVVCADRNCVRVFRCQTQFLIHKVEDYEFKGSCLKCHTEFTSFKALIKHRRGCYGMTKVQDLIKHEVSGTQGSKPMTRNTQTQGVQSEQAMKLNQKGFITVGTLKQLHDKSRGTVVKFTQKLRRMHPDTYGTHTNVGHLARCVEEVLEKVICKTINRGEYFVPKRKKRKIRRYYK